MNVKTIGTWRYPVPQAGERSMFFVDESVLRDLDVYMKDQERLTCVTNYLEDEMAELVRDAKIKLKSVVHPDHVMDLMDILAYGYFEGIEGAKKMANRLGLTKKHFHAIEGDLQEMKSIIIDEAAAEQEWA